MFLYAKSLQGSLQSKKCHSCKPNFILAEGAVGDSSVSVLCSQNFPIVERSCVLLSSFDTKVLLYVTKSLTKLISLSSRMPHLAQQTGQFMLPGK